MYVMSNDKQIKDSAVNKVSTDINKNVRGVDNDTPKNLTAISKVSENVKKNDTLFIRGSSDSQKTGTGEDEEILELDETSSFYKRQFLPTDRGWAWVICFAGFLAYFSIGVSNQTLAVLFVELVEYYNTTITITSLMFTFSIFAVGCTSIICTNFIVPRVGERTVVSIAGILASLGSLGLSFVPNIAFFIVVAVFKGFAAGAVFVPSISLIRHYFYRRRSIAQILANVGQSVAVIVAPPVIREIRKEYGIPGTFMIVAGIELHITVAGLLLRPISAYRFRGVVQPLADDKPIADMVSEDCNEYKLNTRKPQAKRYAMVRNVNNSSSRKTSAAALPNEKSKRISHSVDPEKSPKSLHTSATASSTSFYEFSEPENLKPVTDSDEEESEQAKFTRYWTLRFLLLATIPGAANLHLRNYIPAITDSLGASLDESALLLTIVGSVDLVSRLAIGMFADLYLLSAVQIVTCTQIALGTVCHIASFFTHFKHLIVLAILIGSFVGTRVSMLPLVAMEVAGVDKMPQTLSILSTVGVISSALMNPIFGAVAQSDGNFFMVMHLLGGCFYFSSAVLLFLPIFLKLHTWKKFPDKRSTTPTRLKKEVLLARKSSIVASRISFVEDTISIVPLSKKSQA